MARSRRSGSSDGGSPRCIRAARLPSSTAPPSSRARWGSTSRRADRRRPRTCTGAARTGRRTSGAARAVAAVAAAAAASAAAIGTAGWMARRQCLLRACTRRAGRSRRARVPTPATCTPSPGRDYVTVLVAGRARAVADVGLMATNINQRAKSTMFSGEVRERRCTQTDYRRDQRVPLLWRSCVWPS